MKGSVSKTVNYELRTISWIGSGPNVGAGIVLCGRDDFSNDQNLDQPIGVELGKRADDSSQTRGKIAG